MILFSRPSIPSAPRWKRCTLVRRVDRGVPEAWGSVYDIRELLDSTVKLMDGRSPLEMKLPMPLSSTQKPILRKIDKTVVGVAGC